MLTPSGLERGRRPSKVSAFSKSESESTAKRLLSKKELAEILGVSSRTIETWLSQRLIPQLRLSPRLTRFDLPKVLAALARYEVKEVGGAL
jgi:excisionase family DNA binding protein